jgi:hypothetical protein
MSNNNSSNNNNKNSKIIRLKQSEVLKQSGLVINSVYYIDTYDIKISLNHNTCADIIFTIDRKRWQNNLNTIYQLAEENGIHNTESKKLLQHHLNYNHDEIVTHFTTTNNDRDQEEKEEESKSLPQILIELVLENSIELFVDEFKVPHIQVVLGDHYRTLPIDSTEFKRYLLKLYYDTKDGKIANIESINSAVAQLEAKATFEGRTIPLHFRVAWSSSDTTDTIIYDLSDEKNRCIKVTKDGWEIVENQSQVLFRRYNHLQAQIEPLKKMSLTDNIDATDSKMFDEFISIFNIKNKVGIKDNILLLKCYLISLFIPDIPKPILLLHGEQGGAKSTFQELIKMLVDPSNIQTLTFPRDSNEFIQQLSHNFIAYYDNVSVIQDWISDLLCRAVTGSSFSKRALYTNDDDFYYNFKRVIGINGIDLAATKADLLDRSIIIQTERIEKKDRIKIKIIWEKFNKIKPYVLGYIFDIISKVLQYKAEHGEIDFPNGLNRMADWEEYAEIISRCMGNPEGEFQRVYQENIGVQVDEAIASSPLSQTIIELMRDETIIDKETEEQTTKPKEPWIGTPTALHIELENIAVTKLNINTAKIKSFPKSASHLTRRLNGIKTNLREKGIEITTGNKDSKDKRLIIISKMPSVSSVSSTDDKSSTNQPEKVDGTENVDQVPSKVPSTNTSEFQAQKPNLDDTDSKDGTLPTTIEESREEKWYREQEEKKNWNIGLE